MNITPKGPITSFGDVPATVQSLEDYLFPDLQTKDLKP